jgi:hypothetical protein
VLAAAVVVALGVAGALLVAGTDEPAGRTIAFEIPPGAMQRLERAGKDAGRDRIEARVGDVLLIDNNDSVVHSIAGVEAFPGQQLRLPLRRAGTLLTSCALRDDSRTVIVVSER